ncbi:MAG TPA: serine/threonine-protein kinase [Polyangiaceae bacterium]
MDKEAPTVEPLTTGAAGLMADGGAFVGPVRAGELVADKYRVQDTLGVGGMGVVMAAHDELLERRVAIKFLQPRLVGTDVAMQRFAREARAASRISSEHVVRLLEIGKLPGGVPYFVMEYLHGRDLRAVLREDGPLAPSVAVDYLLQALEAVAEGHLQGIVHRDIKPGNLFLSSRADGTPLIKVLDFGIAKRLESDSEGPEASLTSTEDIRLGSPAYMPPEQLQDAREVDTRSDIWSVGATLYELLCGKPPFQGADYLELVSRILSAPPTPLGSRQLPHALPVGLERVILRCLEKDRHLRFANAAELAEALAPFGGDDARTSLSRVTGLHASSSSMAVTRNIHEPVGSASTTLPVTGDSSSPTAAPLVRRAPGRRVGTLLLGAAAIPALLLVLRAQGILGSNVAKSLEPAPSARSNAQQPSLALTALVADAPAEQATSAAAATRADTRSPPSHADTKSPAKQQAIPAPRSSAAASQSHARASTHAPETEQTQLLGLEPEQPTRQPPQQATRQQPRDETIERLIQTRR